MDSIMKTAAVSTLAPKIAKKFRFSWLIYGAVAYLGIRYLNKKGILPKQTGAALDLVDRGVATAKEHLGFKHTPRTESAPQQNVLH